MTATNAFLVVCRDAAGAVAKRTGLLDEHLRYVVSVEARYRIAGVILAEDQQSVVGSAVVVHARDSADARRVMTEDPYYGAGVWAEIEVMPYLIAFGNMTPRPLDRSTEVPGYRDSAPPPGGSTEGE